MPFDDIFITELKKVSSRIGEEFNQGAAANRHLADWSQEHKDRIKGGYCRGACLHWLQRVLPATAADKADKIQVRGRRGSVSSMATAYIQGYDIRDANSATRAANIQHAQEWLQRRKRKSGGATLFRRLHTVQRTRPNQQDPGHARGAGDKEKYSDYHA